MDTKRYYLQNFPYAAIEQLVNFSGNPIVNREFAVEGEYFKRYIGIHELRRLVLTMQTIRSIHIGAIFTNEPSRKRISLPLKRELIFDLDLTDYDHLKLTSRGADGTEQFDLEACDRAWPFAAIGIFLLRYLLREAFGYERFMVVYSGRRGAHLWVLDERAQGASDELRASIATFLNLDLTPGNRPRATKRLLSLVDTYDLWPVIEEAFTDLIVDGGHFDDYGNLETFVERLDLGHRDGVRNLADDADSKGSAAAAWAHVKRTVQGLSDRTGAPSIYDRLRTTMLAYVWPRIDFPVTKSLNHLIKSPWCAHAKTGRIAIPLDPKDYWRFDPRTAPTVSNLGDDWEQNTRDVNK